MVRTTQLSDDQTVIDLGIGQPPMELLPLALLHQSAERRFTDGSRSWLQYGPEEGDGYFRLGLAAYLSHAYRMPVAAEELFITAGASQGLYLLCTLFGQPGDIVLVEDPSYFLALEMFADLGLQVEGLPMDQDGVIIDALEARLKRGAETKKPAFLYTIPTYQNPTGRTLSAERRKQVASICAQYRLPIVADEVYHLLAIDGEPPLPMRAWDEAGNVFSLGSFSKILAPGVRLGWIQTSPEMVHRLAKMGLVKSGGGLNPFASALVFNLVESDALAANVERLIEAYRARRDKLCDSLASTLGEMASFERPAGGYFVWLHTPGVDLRRMVAPARSAGIAYHPGGLFSRDTVFTEYARLCFAHYSPAELAKAAQLLDMVLRENR